MSKGEPEGATPISPWIIEIKASKIASLSLFRFSSVLKLSEAG
jgi:hypothetical protein